jgi:hypothetical protein
MFSKVLSGSALICYVNGQMYGKIDSFQYSDSTPHKSLGGVDIVLPIEIAPTTKRFTASMTVFRLRGDGGAEGGGLAGTGSNLSLERYFTFMIIDRLTDTVVFRSDYNKATSQNWTMNNKALVTGTIGFTGIVWSNEQANL